MTPIPLSYSADSLRQRSGLSLGRAALMLLGALGLAACSTLGASGPSTGSVRGAERAQYADHGIQIVNLDTRVLREQLHYRNASSFAEAFVGKRGDGLVVGKGDVLDVAIWEAPPAVLFGVGGTVGSITAGAGARSAAIPQQRIGEDGLATIPFAGRIAVVGRTPAQIEDEIKARLRGRAHDPQVVVRLVQNETQTVTVLGEVASSGQVPLTARGERLLDVLAASGGPRQPVGKSSVQLARGNTLASMPLERVIADPAQNIVVEPGDIVTVMHQPFSFVALGAVIRSAEIPFEGSGLTLAEALGRVGGLNDQRADIKGVFVFRMERADAVRGLVDASASTTLEGKVPVIYRLDLSDPASLFAMQDFAMQDKDVLYVSTAPGSDLQRFISTISSAAFSVVGISNALKKN